MQTPTHGHDPVMLPEVLQHLHLNQPHPLTLMDCTLGRGGHASHIARALPPGSTLIALDVDPENLKFARQRIEQELAALPPDVDQSKIENPKSKITLRTFHANFAEAPDVLHAINPDNPPKLNALLADFGVSTNQLLDSSHGLSFNTELPLDMRLDPRIKKTAADLLAHLSEQQLADILHHNAQERFAYRIARKIVQSRTAEPLKTTTQLARLVRSVQPPAKHKGGQIDPATRTFQALRMAVNQELESIQDLLNALPDMLAPNATAVFLSFHSGEDRLIKQTLKQWEQENKAQLVTKKPMEPSDQESQKNPRASSAKLRALRWL